MSFLDRMHEEALDEIERLEGLVEALATACVNLWAVVEAKLPNDADAKEAVMIAKRQVTEAALAQRKTP